MDVQSRRWAIILAGGEGRRLASYTRRITGRTTPKQFCRLIGSTSLLEQTMDRVSLGVARSRTLITLTRSQEQFYLPLTASVSQRRLVVQPANRDTAPAILYSLLRLSVREPRAAVALFPCDHYVSDDALFMNHVETAFRALETQPGLIVLLGIPPQSAETGYGWIEPRQASDCAPAPLLGVCGFWEKPSIGLAQELWRRGCLWNSFVIVARLPVLLRMIRERLPNMYAVFSGLLPALETEYESQTVELAYKTLTPTNFSRAVLAASKSSLTVLPVEGLEWNDLGDARRVLDTLCRIQQHKQYSHG
jgi:mannose-1-phosphate guanylyltransferase